MDNTEQDKGMFGGLVDKAKEMMGGSKDTAQQGQDTFGQRTHEGEGVNTQDETSGYDTGGSFNRETTAQDRPVSTGVGNPETGEYTRDTGFSTGSEPSGGFESSSGYEREGSRGSELTGDEASSRESDYGTSREGGNY